MKIEVQDGDNKPVIYVLSSDETYIGSRDSNDIVISSNEISAKHLKLVIVDESCFVIDQGSTNGTHVDETQLVPGRRFELIPFEPIRLGHKVFITLLEDKIKTKSKKVNQAEIPIDEQAPEVKTKKITANAFNEKTRVISLKEMGIAQTITAAKKREKLAVKRKIESERIKKEKAALKRVTHIAIGWILGGILLQVALKNLPPLMKKSYAPQKVYIDRVALDETLEGQEEEFKVPKENIHSNETLISYLNKKKCTSSIEIVFCNKLPEYRAESNGVIELDGDLVFFMQKRNWYAKAMAVLKSEEDTTSDVDIKKMATIQLIEEGFGKSIPEDFKPRNFYVVLYSTPNDLDVVAVFKSSLLATISMKIYQLEHKQTVTDNFALIKSLSIYIQFPYINSF